MPTATKLHIALFLITVLVMPLALLAGQESARPLPEVTEHGDPLYPPLARMAQIRGQVRFRVTTNGHAVTDVAILEGHPLLAQSAKENIRTWKFVDHVPGTFDVTFNFRMLEQTGTFLREPGLVEVVESPESGISKYSLPEQWNAEVRYADGTIVTGLTLWTYSSFEPEIDGYTTGPQGRERAIRDAHIDGDMLGFDATLEDKYGQRLKFSMIGKMSGDKINGVALNYRGASGTWTAERAAKASAKPSSEQAENGGETKIADSDVAYHESPRYSYFANEAGIEGTVQLRVTTNGHSATQFEVESGNPFLVRGAIENLRSWRFAGNAPRAFEVTFTYHLRTAQVEFLKSPGVVTVEGTLPLVNGGGGYFTTPPEIWQLEFVSSRGRSHAKLSLVKTYDMPDGYVINEAPGWAGKKREAIRQGHQDGDILGFDATLNGPDGKPLKVSVLGKKSRNKVVGIFLDYSGKSGTWTAVRQPSPAKPAR